MKLVNSFQCRWQNMDSNQLTNSNNDHSNALLFVDSHKWILDGASLEPTWVQAHKHIPSEPDLSLLICFSAWPIFFSYTKTFPCSTKQCPRTEPNSHSSGARTWKEDPFLWNNSDWLNLADILTSANHWGQVEWGSLLAGPGDKLTTVLWTG